MICSDIKKLVTYGVEKGLLEPEDVTDTTNQLLALLKLSFYEEPTEEYHSIELEPVLASILDYAWQQGLLEENTTVYRDLFDTAIMGELMPRPSTVIANFRKLYRENPEKATDYFYKLSQDSDYIRRYRIRKDEKWVTPTEYGTLELTVNLSKPEKDPKAIAAAGKVRAVGYPKCLLCRENEGYAGRVDHPARQNHRVIPLDISGESWGLQYSPYVYYPEHCIVFNMEHVPMKIDRRAFEKLLDFIARFPHYFVGSNADLPIVGGSILSHEHFQGGHHEFAMAKAPIERHVHIKEYKDVEAGIVKWPMSVIRLRSRDAGRLAALSEHILNTWRNYTDEQAFIYAETDGVPHNTITPICRKRGEYFEMDLVLRNNITTEEHPLGVFHPHAGLHHIKKENIGLIEVMGLAVLPSRLKAEMEQLAQAILDNRNVRGDSVLEKHADWVEEFLPSYPDVNRDNIHEILRREIGRVFREVLEDAGVYKRTEEGNAAFLRFIEKL
ncbi:UDP-glucose--hexose-1-phosphate uridylyltransferase [Ruminococcus sp. OA3]|uniref:UDP-glucose--hexose-1-phosphate uridylyltransferase n=1 Tax=Ruminococcus sp. OA3 TaxID=2914164 RepID=UPI001F057444|nr:UDP-glucose--hexose-1-phosphate uridylyltransferase [Ruminococcus sp. OA3]MCH1982065.1 UDP-glucose--hexose-1-phosphate uridylyltransferase [Ruminococcus sp. OA3]